MIILTNKNRLSISKEMSTKGHFAAYNKIREDIEEAASQLKKLRTEQWVLFAEAVINTLNDEKYFAIYIDGLGACRPLKEIIDADPTINIESEAQIIVPRSTEDPSKFDKEKAYLIYSGGQINDCSGIDIHLENLDDAEFTKYYRRCWKGHYGNTFKNQCYCDICASDCNHPKICGCPAVLKTELLIMDHYKID